MTPPENSALINTFSKRTGYKINRQNSVEILYKNNKHTGKKIVETISFTIASNKYLRINSTKEVKLPQ